jgi:DnaJ-class molecular chaperone
MSDWQPATHYDCLEVNRDASEEEITSNFRLLRNVWHTDRFETNPQTKERATKRLEQLQEAYEVLSDPRRRQAYDDMLPSTAPTISVSAFPDPLQNRAKTWKRLATYMKQEDLGSAFQRKMAFTAGDLINRGLIPSDKQRPWMLQAWELAVSAGFDPEDADQ